MSEDSDADTVHAPVITGGLKNLHDHQRRRVRAASTPTAACHSPNTLKIATLPTPWVLCRATRLPVGDCWEALYTEERAADASSRAQRRCDNQHETPHCDGAAMAATGGR